MVKNKPISLNVLIITYIVLLVIELFFCVPYQRIQIFKSKQNVPHTEIIGNGYSTIFEIQDNYAGEDSYDNPSTGKRVDTAQIIINISITTALAVSIYFLFIYKKRVENYNRTP